MEVYNSLEFLRLFADDTIDGANPTLKPENGVRALMNLVQQDYKFDLGLIDIRTGRKPEVEGLVESVYASYPNETEWIKEFADRDYVADVILKNNIDPEKYVEGIQHYIKKWKSNEGKMSFEDGYEATHWVWGLYVICKDNHILRNYKKLMSDCLVMIHNTFPASDLKTESIYFLTLIDLSRVKETWIIDLEKTQMENGDFTTPYSDETDLSPEQLRIYSVHHICLALLALYNYYHNIREKG